MTSESTEHMVWSDLVCFDESRKQVVSLHSFATFIYAYSCDDKSCGEILLFKLRVGAYIHRQFQCLDVSQFHLAINMLSKKKHDTGSLVKYTSIPAVAERPRDALCLSVASIVQYVERKFRFRFTAAYK